MKIALFIDGGHLRANAKLSGIDYTPDFIEKFAHGCVNQAEETLLRALYYDCPEFTGTRNLPISGKPFGFNARPQWWEDLASRDLIAVRKGHLAWRGWKLRKTLPVRNKPLTDADFKPNFEQKGVDMRIGLDIATMSTERTVERIVLVSGDTDMIPAMKHARKAGLQIVGVQLPAPPAPKLTPEFLAHVDFKRSAAWPPGFGSKPPP